MSSRALRRLHGSSHPELPDTLKATASTEEEPEEEPSGQQSVVNRFGLLGFDDEAADGSDDNGDHLSHEAASSDAAVVSGSGTKKAKKSNKKKQKKKQTRPDQDTGGDPDEIESALKAIHIAGAAAGTTSSVRQPDTSVARKQLLSVQHRLLNPINEVKKLFGSKVVQPKGSRKAVGSARSYRRPTYLTVPEDAWWRMGKTGLSMVPKQVVGHCQYFVFEHSHEYQKVQAMFWEAVETMDPDNVVAILNLHPYHIDSLLQLSDVCRLSEDLQMAASLLERSLFVFERAFHPLFNLTTGNCRLDFRHWENRSFFVALFRQIRFTSDRGCQRTALELCKLLLSLDPEGDPLCALLMIDMYALNSDEYGFLVELFDEWEPQRNLSKLPNFAYSVPLALYHLSCASGDANDQTQRSRADAMLRSALVMFPGLLMPLLDKLNVNPGFDAAAEKLFGANAQLRQPTALQQLTSLYIDRCHTLWEPASVVEWLEGNVAKLVKESTDPSIVSEIARAARAREACFRGSTPLNVYRHLIMSEVKSVSIALPPEYASVPIVGYDPLPPRDSIQSYARPERRRRVQSQSALSAFFSSLLPNFNVQEPAAVDENGAAVAAPQNLREGIDALMNAMRHMLQNIQMAPPPREDGEGVEGDEPVDDEDWD